MYRVAMALAFVLMVWRAPAAARAPPHATFSPQGHHEFGPRFYQPTYGAPGTVFAAEPAAAPTELFYHDQRYQTVPAPRQQYFQQLPAASAPNYVNYAHLLLNQPTQSAAFTVSASPLHVEAPKPSASDHLVYHGAGPRPRLQLHQPLQFQQPHLQLQHHALPLKSLPLFHNQVFHTAALNPAAALPTPPRLLSDFQPMVPAPRPVKQQPPERAPHRESPRAQESRDEDDENTEEHSDVREGYDFDDGFKPPNFKFSENFEEDEEDSRYRLPEESLDDEEEEGGESATKYTHSKPSQPLRATSKLPKDREYKFSSYKFSKPSLKKSESHDEPKVEYKAYKFMKTVSSPKGDSESKASDHVPVVYREKKYRENNWYISKTTSE